MRLFDLFPSASFEHKALQNTQTCCLFIRIVLELFVELLEGYLLVFVRDDVEFIKIQLKA